MKTSTPSTISSAYIRLLPAALVITFVLAGMLTLTTFPPVNYLGDELGFLESARTLEGGVPIDSPLAPKLYLWALHMMLALPGEPLYLGRLMTLLMSAGVMALSYLIARELAGPRAGLVAMAFVMSDYIFNWTSRLIRPEVLSCLMVASACYLIVLSKRTGIWAMALAGFVTGASVLAHPNNAQYVLGVPVFAGILYGKDITLRRAGAFALGIMAGLLIWAGMASAPSAMKAAEGKTGAGVIYQMPLMSKGFWKVLTSAASTYFNDYVVSYIQRADKLFWNSVSFIYYAAVLAIVLAAGLMTTRRRAVMALVAFPAMTLFINYFLTDKFGLWHIAELHPFIAMAAAISVVSTAEAAPDKLKPMALWAIPAMLVLPALWDIGASVRTMSAYKYEQFIGAVAAEIPEGSAALAHEIYSPALKNRYRPLMYDVEHPYRNCEHIRLIIARHKAGYVVIDNSVRGMMATACGPQYEADALRYLEANADLTGDHARLAYPNYWAARGMIEGVRVYKLRQ